MRVRQVIAASLVVALAFGAAAVEPAGMDHRLSVRDIMLSVITPATNTLWGIEDPETDDDWIVYEQAALTVITAGTVIREGGSGASDNAWAADARWRRFTDTMLDAAEKALSAARQRDLDAFIDATNNDLYPPCEECHLAFSPGMQ